MHGTGESGRRQLPTTAEGVTPVIAQDPEPYRASDSGETGHAGAEGAGKARLKPDPVFRNSQAKGQRGEWSVAPIGRPAGEPDRPIHAAPPTLPFSDLP